MRFDKWTIKLKRPSEPIEAVICERQKASSFVLDPNYEDLSSPGTIHDLEAACEIIKSAISDKKKIGIFMDYDADGVCSGAILYKTLKILKALCEYYVPRRSEGYGLSKGAIKYFVKKGVELIITVDCGVKNFEEIKFAKDKGLKVIVTDHHLIGDKLPDADALVHPGIGENNFKDYSGAGVAFQLARQLLDGDDRIKWLLDLAAISTIADVVPLIGDNRIIASYGFIVLNKTKNVGLRYLIEGADLSQREIGSYEVGYMIAPRLNAAGRLTKPEDSFRLLIASDESEAKILADKLNKYNVVRQKQLSDSLEEAIKIVENKKLYREKIIVIKGNWNEGIVGLVSGKITNLYNRPSIVLTKVDGKLKGSARSISKIDITARIGKFKKLLLSYGGHKQASGLSLKETDYSKFKKSIEKDMSKLDNKLFVKELVIDASVGMNDLDLNLGKKIQKLAPFGIGNPQPVFCLESVSVENMRIVGRDNNHMSLNICDGGNYCKAILFDYDEDVFNIKEGQPYDFAFRVMVDSWGGREKINLNIIDAKASK